MEKNITLTIGRQFGSGGREIGKMVAARLGIGFYDKTLITEAARRSGLSSELFEKNDEKAFNGLIHALSVSFGFGGFSAESIFKIQSDTIKELAAAGSCVIVGRCADYVLRDKKDCYNIFIHSPLPDRIGRIAARTGKTGKEAEELIEKTDKSRAAYYDFYTGKRWGEGKSYHLCIDSSVLGAEATAEAICEFVLRAAGGSK